MKRRIVETATQPDIVKRREGSGTVAVRCAAVIAVTLCGILAAAWGFCFVVLKGPSETARDEFVISLSENAVTRFVPGLFLDDETVEKILAEE